MFSKPDKIWLALFAALVLSISGCANKNTQDSSSLSTSPQTLSSSLTNNPPPAQNNNNTNTGNNSTQPALQFQVNGTGNHDQYICVPAHTKLQLRMKPHANNSTLLPPSATPTYSDGTPVYDGSPAYYNQLRVRLEIQGTAAAWDYTAGDENWSVAGDYSTYIASASSVSVNTSCNGQADPLPTPEYTDVWILGSDPNDGKCTYWEQQLGKCSCVSPELKQADAATCGNGKVKILVTKIVSDYPCNYDRIGWCRGGSVQIVPDDQQWSITVEAVTENTQGF